ncbi:hypothetical protein [Paenibacillus beijingensis]|nr:hypothetical protein [Paenibacillus beijingensis]
MPPFRYPAHGDAEADVQVDADRRAPLSLISLIFFSNASDIN